MSEEIVAFAPQDGPSEPFDAGAFAPRDDAAESMDTAAQPRGNPRHDAPGSGPQPAESADNGAAPVPPLIAAVLAPSGQQFLRGVLGALAQDATRPEEDVTGLGVVLCQLGWALSEGQDETLTLQELVEAFDGRRIGKAGLRGVAPIVAAFIARTAAAPRLRDGSTASASEMENLVRAAEDLVDAALESGGARAWCRLPEIAVSIARRVAQRDLPIGALADTLPRLAARFGSGPRDAAVSDMDHPRGTLPRGGAAAAPRRMVISGPVEIVILDR